MNLFTRFNYLEECTGISLHFLQNGDAVIDLCSLKRNGERLDFIKKATDIPHVNGLIKNVSEKALVALNLSGRGIVQKKLAENVTDEKEALEKVLPGASADSFYVQVFNAGDATFVSVVRKEDAEKWVRTLSNMDFRVVMISLGAFPVQKILPQLNAYGTELIFNGNIFSFTENAVLKDWTYRSQAQGAFPLKLASEQIDERLLIPYASAFQVLFGDRVDPIQANAGTVKTGLGLVLQTKRLKTLGVAMLICIFLLLFINTLLFTSLYSSNESLSEQLSRTSRNTADVQVLANEVKMNEAFLTELGWDGGMSKSGMVDKIAALLPSEVTWLEVSVDPLDAAATRTDRAVKFSARSVTVIGKSESVLSVNEWVARLKTLRWVINARVNSFSYSTELHTGQFNVTVNY